MSQTAAKRAAARAALDFVKPGMVLGLGTGSTADLFLDLLGQKIAQGLSITGVATSQRTERRAAKNRIPLAPRPPARIDLTIDGADEIDPALCLIKGGGGALLREKITAALSARMVVIADQSKQVAQLGRFPLPVEVFAFGAGPLAQDALARALRQSGVRAPRITLRRTPDGGNFNTDSGNLIYDCACAEIPGPEETARRLDALPCVAGHGLFPGFASCAVIGAPDGSARLIENATETP